MEIIDRYTSFERDWKYISENSKKGFHDKMEYLYQLYHRWVIVKAMHFAVLKKHVNPILEETWWRLFIWYNLSLYEASKKKTSQSKMPLDGEVIALDTYTGDYTHSWNQYLKNSNQTTSSEVYFLNNVNIDFIPSFQRWAPESWDLKYNLENINWNSSVIAGTGTITSNFFWNDFSWFSDFHSGYEHDIRVTSSEFIDCEDTHEFPSTNYYHHNNNLECSPSSVDFIWEDWPVSPEYWYIDTRAGDENQVIFTIGITSTGFIEKNKPYKAIFRVKKIWNDNNMKMVKLRIIVFNKVCKTIKNTYKLI